MELKELLIATIQYIRVLRNELTSPKSKQEVIISTIDQFTLLANALNETLNEIIKVEELNEYLEKLLVAIENNDFELFVDIAEFEIKPLLEYWSLNI
ncbi:hypothetical protein ACFPES_32725 [Paenibacillus sp. GCM10023248]|uniref:hypothetical protein n=1 Tax=unclassified Paenibacillus TaxID=185978 RepID=UPI0023795333|nr:hypothetical protein [Paenibacillus sp. MAHUQ-63]MDD9271804.1 hypothetical protein [Paenibacillus sp. MAHUQ-63]